MLAALAALLILQPPDRAELPELGSSISLTNAQIGGGGVLIQSAEMRAAIEAGDPATVLRLGGSAQEVLDAALIKWPVAEGSNVEIRRSAAELRTLDNGMVLVRVGVIRDGERETPFSVRVDQ